MADEERPPPPPQYRSKMTDHDKHLYEDHSSMSRGRLVLTVVLVLFLLIGVVALVLYLLYRPEKPRFVVMAAAVYNLNVTSSSTLPPLVYATMQFTLLMRNPNMRTRAYYDRLTAYVSYKDQPLTRPVGMPPLSLGKHEGFAMSPVMGGGMPLEATDEVVNGLEMDEGYGVVGVRVVVAGILRWKAGVFWIRGRRLSVRCDVLMGLRKGLVGRVPLLVSPPCKVDA